MEKAFVIDSAAAGSGQGDEAPDRIDPDRLRGSLDDSGNMEDLVYNLFELEFMEGQGLRQPEDEATAEDEDTEQLAGTWTNERLDKPLHQHTEMSVRELVWSVMDVCKDTVKGKPLDELIKVFKRALPKDNCMPGFARSPSNPLHHVLLGSHRLHA
jgi:hypothetical protein